MLGTLSPGGAERQAVVTMQGLSARLQGPLAMVAMYLESETQRFFIPALEAACLPVAALDRNPARDTTKLLSQVMQATAILSYRLAEVMNFARTIAMQNPEVVHLWLDEVNIQGGLAAVAVGVPRIILSGRNLPPNNFLLYQPYMREAYRWLLQQPGVTLINNSAAGARAYESWLGLPSGRIRVVHNGFNFDQELLEQCRSRRAVYRERHDIPTTAQVMGTVIRLNEEKRPLLWAEIAARVRKALPEAHFLVVGDGPLRKELEVRAAEPDLAGNLHLAGLEKQSLEAMAAMDLFLLSSRGEGLPNVLVEAQAMGVPVVTTRAGGAPEALDEERTGWVLSSDNPEIAAMEIVRLLKNGSWLRAAGRAGPGFVKSHFGLERMLDETLEVYGDKRFQLTNEKQSAIQ